MRLQLIDVWLSEPSIICWLEFVGYIEADLWTLCWKHLVRIGIDFPKSCFVVADSLVVAGFLWSTVKEVCCQLFSDLQAFTPSKDILHRHLLGFLSFLSILLLPCLSSPPFLTGACHFFLLLLSAPVELWCCEKQKEPEHLKRHCIIYPVLRWHRWKQSGFKSLVELLGK